MHCTVQPGRYCMLVFSGGRLPCEKAPRGGKMTATAEILLRSGFGVNRKGLQDVVVRLLCGKGPRKMTSRKDGEDWLRINHQQRVEELWQMWNFRLAAGSRGCRI